jgi:hypothetical protein
MKLNIKTVLAREQERKNEVKPLPKIRVGETATSAPPRENSTPPLAPPLITATIPIAPPSDKEGLLADLRNRFTEVKKVRAKLSTRTAHLVQELHDRLMKEGPAMANAFMAGELSMPELRQHYTEIQSLSDRALKLYDDIHYVELNGTLPSAAIPSILSEVPAEVKAVQYEIRRLDDLIHKTGKKLKDGKPKNVDRVNVWKQKIALAIVKRDDLQAKLKRMQYGARSERTGE